MENKKTTFEGFRKYLEQKKETSIKDVVISPEKVIIDRIINDYEELLDSVLNRCNLTNSYSPYKTLLFNFYLGAVLELAESIDFLAYVEDISSKEELDTILKECGTKVDKGVDNSTEYLKKLISKL